MEIWGGCECTVNRVGDRYFDQVRRTGHQDRLDDLDRLAELGLTAVRQPALWEKICPDGPESFEWTWTDARLERLRALNLRPILGLLHHGSGPPWTGLLDPAFPDRFAAFAAAAARRYPDVRDWTPVNEPVTTARFTGLYGHWHPHQRDERAFWTILVAEIEATARAMDEIRTVRPDARLIQTEDLGRTYATPPVAHQASFDNLRRWAGFDLLTGRLGPDHPLFARLEGFGLGERLRRLADRPCPPDVFGVNHYLTSDRFLDHRWADYPPERRGGNDFMRFADVEAVRVIAPGPAGLEGALEETHARYGGTLAVTEGHAGCTREEQVRWVLEGAETCRALNARGVPVEAYTVWALLGGYDWSSLLTREEGRYEPGAFDVSGGRPRPTALARAVRTLTAGDPPPPAAAGLGWWRRDVRLQHRPVFRSVEDPLPPRRWRGAGGPPRPLLILGASGTLGRAFARTCAWRDLAYHLADRREAPLDAPDRLARLIEALNPWAVVNATGYVRVDEAERDERACFEVNAEGAGRVAAVCAAAGVPCLGFSSDLVFDGRARAPYAESAATNPLGVYGRSKAEGEARVLAAGGSALIVRTAAFFSPYDPHNFAAHVARRLAADAEVEAARDLVVSPTYVPDLVDAALDLLIDGETGVWHLANAGRVRWSQFAHEIAQALGRDPRLVRPRPWRDLGWAAERPRQAALTSERGRLMAPLSDALQRYARALLGLSEGMAPGGAAAPAFAPAAAEG